MFQQKSTKIQLILLVIILASVYGWYRSWRFGERTSVELAAVKVEFASSTVAFEKKVQDLENDLATAEEEKDDLADDLRSERKRVNTLADKVEEVTDTVGVLDKLAKTDKELLAKYSKIYFLNENYAPSKMVLIAENYLENPKDPLLIHVGVWPHLQKMMDKAADDDKIILKIVSAFRSFGEQSLLKAGYKVTYGAGANQFSADQGYSEHQLATTVDLMTPTSPGLTLQFEKTPAYDWLTKNAHRYGFVLSYPKNNAYYQFEPWHWRFVGRELAERLFKENKNFYDLDQREIDQYLVKFFD